MDLSIIIVSWNVRDLLQQCLESIYKYQSGLVLEVFVVDNASADNTAEMIKENFPQVNFIANANNLGFAAANNQAIRKAGGDLLLLLNPDTKILPNTFEELLKFINKNERIGILGGKHLNPDFTHQPSVRRFPTIAAILLIFLKVAKILPNISPVYSYFAKDFDYKIAQPVDQVAGSCLLIRRKVIDKIGMFDENFFTWFEEVDLCRRAKAAGWEIWYTPSAEIIHYGGRSFGQQVTWKNQKVFFQSANYYFHKHGFK